MEIGKVIGGRTGIVAEQPAATFHDPKHTADIAQLQISIAAIFEPQIVARGKCAGLHHRFAQRAARRQVAGGCRLSGSARVGSSARNVNVIGI